jgi:DNA-binding NtrC family response regulator
MPNAMTLLLVEDSKQQSQKLTAILEFVAQGAVSVTDSESVLGRLEEKFEAILLGTCGTSENLARIYSAIQELDEAPPILLLISDEEEKTLNKDVVQGAFAMLNLPMRYAEVSDAMHRAQVFNLGRQQSGGGINLDLFRSLVGISGPFI